MIALATPPAAHVYCEFLQWQIWGECPGDAVSFFSPCSNLSSPARAHFLDVWLQEGWCSGVAFPPVARSLILTLGHTDLPALENFFWGVWVFLVGFFYGYGLEAQRDCRLMP